MRESIEGAREMHELAPSADRLADALAATERAVAALLAENDKRALAHGTPFLFGFGHLVIGWLWLQQAQLAARLFADPETDFARPFLKGRMRACRYFAETELPKTAVWLQPVEAGSDLVHSMPVDQF